MDPSASHNRKHTAGNGGGNNEGSGIANINFVNHNRNFNIEFNIITKKFNTVKAIDEYLTQYPLINKEVIRKSSSSYVEEEL